MVKPVKVGDKVTWNVWGIQYVGEVVKLFSRQNLYDNNTVLVRSSSGQVVPVVNYTIIKG